MTNPRPPTRFSLHNDIGDEPRLGDIASVSVEGLIDAVESASTKSERRHRWALPLRLAVSFLMLAVLWWRFPEINWGDLIPTWSTNTILWLVAATAMTFCAIVLSAVRWHVVLRALGLYERIRLLVPIYFAGQFVSNVLPTTIGGDVLRVSRLSKMNGNPETTFASVALERLTGWLVLPIITLFGLAINPGLRELDRATLLAFAVAVVTLVALVVILFAANHPRLGGRYAANEGWRRFVLAIHESVAELRRQPLAALGILIAGLIYQIALCLTALMVAAALGFSWLGLTALLAFYPAVLILQVLPIGIAGLGVRESAFVLLLVPLGVPAEKAVALGLVLYAINVIASLLGAPTFAMGGHRRQLSS
ncbi:MAG: lysylphosphatidylglycerol synthase transmembrane domain-containing protein [Acidimicrobiales bacterium]